MICALGDNQNCKNSFSLFKILKTHEEFRITCSLNRVCKFLTMVQASNVKTLVPFTRDFFTDNFSLSRIYHHWFNSLSGRVHILQRCLLSLWFDDINWNWKFSILEKFEDFSLYIVIKEWEIEIHHSSLPNISIVVCLFFTAFRE